MPQYEVVPIKSGMFTGKFDPKLLQNYLNGKAKQGWKFRATFKEETHGFLPFSKREAVFIILEKE